MTEGGGEAAGAVFERWRVRGDPADLGLVFDRTAPELLLIAHRLAGPVSAEDLVQETFLRAIERRDRWDAQRPLVPWLVGILVRVARRQRERAARRTELELLPPSPASDPAAEAERAEFAQGLSRGLESLPQGQRSALILNLVHGLGPTAIADALGEPLATVKSRLARGKRALRDTLPVGLVPAIALNTDLASARSALLEAARQNLAATTAVAATGAGGLGALLAMKGPTLASAGAMLLAGTAALIWVRTGSDAEHRGEPPRSVPEEPPLASVEIPAQTPLEPAPLALLEPDRTSARATIAAGVEPPLDPTALLGVIRGRVVDEDGAGLKGVQVFLAVPGRHPEFSRAANFLLERRPGEDFQVPEEVEATVTDEGGWFELDRPGDGLRRGLLAWSPERGCVDAEPPEPGDAAEEAEPDPAVLVLPRGFSLSARVRRADDLGPVPGASVSFYPEHSGFPLAFLNTDSEGRAATVPLAPGPYVLLATADGYADAWVDGLADQREFDVLLEPLAVLDAVLVDAGGHPWTAGRIEALTGVGSREREFEVLLTTGSYRRRGEVSEDPSDGNRPALEFDGSTGAVSGGLEEPTPRFLSVWHGPTKLGEAELASTEERELEIELARPIGLPLEVLVTLAGDGAGAVPVTVAAGDMVAMGTRFEAFERRDARGGRATLWVPVDMAGRECAVLVEAPGYVESFRWLHLPEDAASGAGLTHEVTLRPAAAELRGRVLGSGGRPPTSVSLSVIDADGGPLSRLVRTRTEALDDGLFVLHDLPEGPVRLLVLGHGHVPLGVDVELPLEEPLELRLIEGRTLDVRSPGSRNLTYRVLDASGLPILDDRLQGQRRFGRLRLQVDGTARAVEAYDAVTGVLFARSEVPVGSVLVLEEP